MAETALSGTVTVGDLLDAHPLLVPSQSEMFRIASNAHADSAMEFGLRGYELTAQAYAQNADLCAMLADAYGRIEAVQRFLR